MKDPIVAEVRKHRMQHTRKFHYDLLAICEDLQSLQKKSGHKIVRLASRKLLPDARTAKRARDAS
jgi:hypothetical protein